MIILAGGCRVYDADDGAVASRGNWTSRTVMSRSTGAPLITQTINEYGPGISAATLNPASEEVHYVAAGTGTCHIDGYQYDVRPGTALFVPPGTTYHVENPGPGTLRIISACCPEDADRRVFDAPHGAKTGTAPNLMVQEADREPMRAGRDREFRLLVNTDVGCKQVTQFIGHIPASKAPFHRHMYEEGICILEGRAILHIKGESSAPELGPGSGVYFPVGVVHCVENPGPDPIRLLGVFHPSGSPAAAYEDG
jgi:mannose-6-phosphate isomerase-like protein (cupin superfamily)